MDHVTADRANPKRGGMALGARSRLSYLYSVSTFNLG